MRMTRRLTAIASAAVLFIGLAAISTPAVASTGGPDATSRTQERSIPDASASQAAAAAVTPAFEIYYSPNCTGASRYYSGQNFGEWWINDKFNLTNSGSAGYGQKIRNNAASVKLYNASLWVATAAEMASSAGTVKFYREGNGCHNLGTTRNANVWWATMYYVP